MMILGAVLIIVGLVLGVPLLLWIGVVLAVIGIVLYLGPGRANHPVGGRRYWY